MQHRYVPDLGDFSKFAVIDALSSGGKLSTVLVWYLVDPHEVGDAHNNDGKHTAYLVDDRQVFAECNPELHRKMRAVHRTGEKHVGVYARHKVLPNTTYFAEPLSDAGVKPTNRVAYRGRWLERALRVAERSDIVVLDPDNGLAPPGLSLNRKQAVKYATPDECAAFYGDGRRTLVLYQHAHRQGPVAQQADRAMARLADRIGVSRKEVFTLRFHRGTARCYLVVPATGQHDRLHQRAHEMVSGPWGRRGHFTLIY